MTSDHPGLPLPGILLGWLSQNPHQNNTYLYCFLLVLFHPLTPTLPLSYKSLFPWCIWGRTRFISTAVRPHHNGIPLKKVSLPSSTRTWMFFLFDTCLWGLLVQGGQNSWTRLSITLADLQLEAEPSLGRLCNWHAEQEATEILRFFSKQQKMMVVARWSHFPDFNP